MSEVERFTAWSNRYRSFLLTPRTEASEIAWRLHIEALPSVLKPLAAAIQKQGLDSAVVWRLIGNPSTNDIEVLLDEVWILARQLEAQPVERADNPPEKVQEGAKSLGETDQDIYDRIIRKFESIFDTMSHAKVGKTMEDEITAAERASYLRIARKKATVSDSIAATFTSKSKSLKRKNSSK